MKRRAMRQRMARIIDAVMLVAVGLQLLYFIGSTPVPSAHVQRECVPIGAALEEIEAQPEYESIGDWVVRR